MSKIKQAMLVCFVSFSIFNIPLIGFEKSFFDSYKSCTSSRRFFRMDVIEKEDEYCIEVELPGVKKENINLSYSGDILVVSYSVKDRHDEEDVNYLHRERVASSSSRSLRLDNAKFDKAKAKLDDGILSVKIPREKIADNYRKIKID